MVQWTCHRRTVSAIHATLHNSVQDATYACNNPFTAPRLARPTGSKGSLATGNCFTHRTRRRGASEDPLESGY